MCESEVDEVVFALEVFGGEGFGLGVEESPVAADFGLAHTRGPAAYAGLAAFPLVRPDHLDLHVGVGQCESDGADDEHGITKLGRLYPLLLRHLKFLIAFLFVHRLHLGVDAFFLHDGLPGFYRRLLLLRKGADLAESG